MQLLHIGFHFLPTAVESMRIISPRPASSAHLSRQLPLGWVHVTSGSVFLQPQFSSPRAQVCSQAASQFTDLPSLFGSSVCPVELFILHPLHKLLDPTRRLIWTYTRLISRCDIANKGEVPAFQLHGYDSTADLVSRHSCGRDPMSGRSWGSRRLA